LLDTASVVPSFPILVTLMMMALSSSETSVLTRAPRCNIPEDAILHSKAIHVTSPGGPQRCETSMFPHLLDNWLVEGDEADLRTQWRMEPATFLLVVWYLTGFPRWWPWFEPGYGNMGFVMDKTALRQVFSECFGFVCQAFYRLLRADHHLGLVQ
jgi:hypothetical protein